RVRTRKRDRERRIHVGDRQAERARLDAIDQHAQLRRVGLALRPHGGEQLALTRRAEQLVARLQQLRGAVTGAVLQLQRETARNPERWNRGRIQYEDERLLDLRQCRVRLADERQRILARAAAFLPRLQRDERHRVGLALAEEAEALEEDDRVNFGL